jgi:hypothetical protein
MRTTLVTLLSAMTFLAAAAVRLQLAAQAHQQEPPGMPAVGANNTSHGDVSRPEKAYRLERNPWIHVHLQGTPSNIGYQHVWLLAAEIEDALPAVKLSETHSTKRDWDRRKQCY